MELRHIGLFYKARDTNLYTFVPNEDLLLDGKLHLASTNVENQPLLPKDVST
jgi:hypothetical protein